jgi:hypothetical protein
MKRVLPIVLAVTVVACGKEVVGPRSGVTLLVTNATCLTGPCDSLRVLAFPSDQPNTPGGYWSLDLGVMTTSQACFTLPPSAHFYVISEPVRSSADTTTFTWTSGMPLSLGAFSPSSSTIQASPTTTAFVPSNAAGWSITFPTGSQATPSSSCTPKSGDDPLR